MDIEDTKHRRASQHWLKWPLKWSRSFLFSKETETFALRFILVPFVRIFSFRLFLVGLFLIYIFPSSLFRRRRFDESHRWFHAVATELILNSVFWVDIVLYIYHFLCSASTTVGHSFHKSRQIVVHGAQWMANGNNKHTQRHCVAIAHEMKNFIIKNRR